jgi:hypothetical protein
MDTEILEWAGKSFASGALSAGGGMAFNTLLGYIGIEQPDAKIRAQLQDISDRLAGLGKSIAEVNQRMINLSKQLAILTQETKEATQEGFLAQAFTAINTHSSGAPPARNKQGSNDDIKISSLADILNARINNEPLSAAMLKTFFNDVIGTWDIPARVNEISRGLLGSGMERGLLSIFTGLSVERMGEAQWDPRLFNFYLNLESCFLSYLGAQMRGVFLVVAAYNYNTPPESVSPRAARYLWGEYVPNVLDPQLDRFLWCAERLALSQGQWRSPWPTTGSSSYTDQQGRVRLAGGLGAPPELAKILLRSELLARRIKETFLDMRNYKPRFPERFPLAELTPLARTKGIYVHRLCREGELNEGKGPELKPWPGYDSRGRVLPGTGSMVPQWGSANGGFAKLMEREQSGIRVVRYFWPEVESPAGKAASFPDALPAGKSYSEADLATALELRWPGFGTATHYLGMKGLCIVPQFATPSAAAWTVSPVAFEKGHNSGTLTSQYLDQPLMSPVSNRSDNRAYFKLEGTKISGRGNAMSVNCRMESPIFSYEGIQPRGVTLHLWMLVTNYRKAYRDKLVNMNGRLIVKLKKPNGEQQIYDSEAAPNFSLWDWNGAGSDAQRQDEPRLSVALNVGTTGKLEQYSLVVHLQVAHQGLGRDIKASIGGLIRECALSWTATIPPMLAKTKKFGAKAGKLV